MAQAVPFLVVASTALNATSAMAEGEAANKAARFEAGQLDQQAKAAVAQSSREAYEQSRVGARLASDARAAMAASGGTTTDAPALKQLGDIKAGTDYNVLATLYEGETKAEGIKKQAAARRFEGKIAKRKGYAKALSSVLSNGPDIYSSFK